MLHFFTSSTIPSLLKRPGEVLIPFIMDNNKLNFITTYLRHRSAYTAYCIAYNVEDQRQYESIMAAAKQLMDDPEWAASSVRYWNTFTTR